MFHVQKGFMEEVSLRKKFCLNFFLLVAANKGRNTLNATFEVVKEEYRMIYIFEKLLILRKCLGWEGGGEALSGCMYLNN